MPKLSIILRPCKDELLTTYIMRIHRIMGSGNLRQFLAGYVRNFEYEGDKHRAVALRYDGQENYMQILRQICSVLMPDKTLSDILYQMSYYVGIAPFMNGFQQTYWVTRLSWNHDGNKLLPQYYKDSIQDLRICPECCKEENTLVYKRIHQMPGVRCCPIHGTALQKYTGKKGKEYDNPRFEPVTDETITSCDIEYAKFAASFFETPLETNSVELAAALKKRMLETDDWKCHVRQIAESLGRENFLKELETFFQLIKTCMGEFDTRLNPEQMLKAVFTMFRDIAEIRTYLTTAYPSETAFIIEAKGRDYTLLSPYQRTMITLRHNACGNEYVTSPEVFAAGWGCPKCDNKKTINRQFSDLLAVKGDGEYELIGDFTGVMDPVIINHLGCGRTFPVPGYAIHRRGKLNCPLCEEDRKKAEFEKYFKETYPEWEIVSYSKMFEPLVIRHSCGHEQSYSRASSVQEHDLKCDGCQRKKPLRYDDDVYRRRLAEATDGRIELMEEYQDSHTELQFRCNVCGHLFSNIPYSVLRGSGCSECAKRLVQGKNKMRDYVSAATGGRYEIVGFNSKYIVHGDGRTLRMSRQLLMQELWRANKSDYINMTDEDKKLLRTRTEKGRDIIMECLKEHQQEMQKFAYTDLYEQIVGQKLCREEFILGWFGVLLTGLVECTNRKKDIYVNKIL